MLLAALPALGLLLYTAHAQREDAIADTQETALRLARLTARDHRRLIETTRELLAILVEVREVRGRDRQACSDLFARLLRQYHHITNVAAADADGRIFCSGVPLSGPVSAKDRLYFRTAMATRDFAVGEFQIGRITGRPALNVAMPAMENGSVRMVVTAGIDLSFLKHIVEETGLPAGTEFTIVDRNGTVLVRQPDGEQWVGKTVPDVPSIAVVRRMGVGVAEAADLDGVRRLLGFVPVLDGGRAGDVFVSFAFPRGAAVADANRLLGWNIGGLLLVTTLAVAGAWVFGDTLVVRRVHGLVAATARIAGGDLRARVRAMRGGELGQLEDGFNAMATAIEARENALQHSLDEIRRHREALTRSEKLAELGRLAAGIAHELRNPLTVIDGRVQMLQRQVRQGTVPPADRLAPHLEGVATATDRMKHIVQGLSNYSRPAKAELVVLDAGQLVAGARELLAYPARERDVAIELDLAPDPLPVKAEPSELTQVLVNLATNAIEVTPRGGRVTLHTGADGDRVIVEVRDTGGGIPADILSHMWEPFYTTKTEGTGLGLSIVAGLVAKQPGARIDVDSLAGRGSTFRVTLPRLAPPTSGASSAS